MQDDGKYASKMCTSDLIRASLIYSLLSLVGMLKNEDKKFVNNSQTIFKFGFVNGQTAKKTSAGQLNIGRNIRCIRIILKKEVEIL